MAFVHNVEIVWDELLSAFTSSQGDRVYFLDRVNGEIFNVPTTLEDEEFWRQMETYQERFLEIPSFDYSSERRMITGFVNGIQDKDLRNMLQSAISGKKPFGNLEDIVSFFPEEYERLQEIRTEFLSSRVRQWLELNNLFTMETDLLLSPNI
jgi:hypothetical protein